MEPFFPYLPVAFLFFLFLSLKILFHKQNPSSTLNLPPGSVGWPVLGETIEYLSNGWRGHPEKFVVDRMTKYSRECFKTSILGQSMAFLLGPSGNKFLFSNENNLVKIWWPDSLKKIFPNALQDNTSEKGKKVRRLLPQLLKPEALQRYVGIVDGITQKHFAYQWEGKGEVTVFHLANEYAFWLACRLFLSVEDPAEAARFRDPFHTLASGMISVPINFPGTPFNKAIKAAKALRKEFMAIVKQRKLDLASEKATPTQDILSHMLSVVDENGETVITESDAVEVIVGWLIAGHDGVSAALTLIAKYLAELPHIYAAVYREQMEIRKSKEAGELLNWEDIQKMNYSWHMACEVMRLLPPSPGIFREATHEFSYADFTIPKGWKLHWSAYSTHHNPEYFPNPEKFDPTRFQGNGPAPYTYVAFGASARMCPGRELARLAILVFMHNMVKRFKWEKLLPHEEITVHLSPTPAKGLPIRLIPHEMSSKED